MRTALLLLFVSGSAYGALAQDYALDRGSYLLAAAVSYTSLGGDLYATEAQDRYGAWGFAPKVEYFVIPRLTLGAFVERSRVSYQSGASARSFAIGPSVAYYFGRPGGGLYPFVTAGAGYSTASTELVSDANDEDGSGLAATVGGGIVVGVRGPLGVIAEGRVQFAGYGADAFGDANKLGVRLGVAYFLF